MNVAGEFLWLLHTLMKITWDEVVSPFLLPKRSKHQSKPKRIESRGRPSRRDNPFKVQYRRKQKLSPEERAIQCQRENIACKSEARDALSVTLRSLSIPHRLEEKVVAFGNTYFVDVWCQQHRIGWECDGAQHRTTRKRDLGRDEDITAVTGFRMIRHWNSWYTKRGLRERILIELGKR